MVAFRSLGMRLAMDELGGGRSGLNVPSALQSERIGLDRSLTEGVHVHRARQAVLRGLLAACRELGVAPVGVDVGDARELGWPRDAGLDLFRGGVAEACLAGDGRGARVPAAR